MRIFILLCLFSFNAFAQVENAIPPTIETLEKSIYKLYAIERDRETIRTVGSGVAISPHYIVTNCHVALSGNFIMVQENNKPYLARLCYFNKSQDICIIDVPNLALRPVSIRDSKELNSGEVVYGIGYPGGVGKVIAHGVVKDPVKTGSTIEVLIKADHGSSGGGLFDSNGNLVGIISGGDHARGVSYAVSTQLILDVIKPHNHPHCSVPDF